MLEVEGLRKEYGTGVKVIDDLSFSVGKGRSMAIIGPSGCGKSTLLYILAGLTPPTAGRVLIEGNEVTAPSRQVGFILQDFGLLPWKTVRDNLCLGMRIRKVPREEQDRRSEEVLRYLGLEAYADRYPGTLSGGERQRLAIGRALALEPTLLLMDEPFSSLDTLTRERLQNALLEMGAQRNLTMVTVTHSIEEAVFLGDSIMVLGGRPCQIKVIIANPGAGERDYRNNDEFFRVCRRVRQAVEAL
ncbi:MAG: ABC transporter ATP-binding protein [Methanomassiliicoccus sp.]|nr:ABC transporter ATP-binding protein [Methanomassiliicoccus sp.]